MRKYMVLCLTAALLISGCLNQTNESADTSTETEEYVLSTPDTYKNLESFIYAYQTSDSPNIRSELPTERIYWINDNNPWKTSLKDIQVREGYFSCHYDNGFVLFTHRLSDGKSGLETMIRNNPDAGSKEVQDGFEYYYSEEEEQRDYLWLQDQTNMLELTIPKNVELNLNELISFLEYPIVKELDHMKSFVTIGFPDNVISKPEALKSALLAHLYLSPPIPETFITLNKSKLFRIK